MKHADLTTLTATFPLVQDLIALKETTWFNPATTTLAEGLPYVGLTADDVQDAHARLQRFAPIWQQPSRKPPRAAGLSNQKWLPFRQ